MCNYTAITGNYNCSNYPPSYFDSYKGNGQPIRTQGTLANGRTVEGAKPS